jgi:hypothetical protein
MRTTCDPDQRQQTLWMRGLDMLLAPPHDMKFITAILLVLVSGMAFAQSPSPATSREIKQLFVALESSRCEFNRNGSWYDARAATEHLQRKYDYLLKKGLVTSTESFIDLAATRSSLSGKQYLVRCGNAQPIPSQLWFTSRLEEWRGQPGSVEGPVKPTPSRGAD